MEPRDIFYYVSSVGIVIAVATLVFLAYQITISLRPLRRILEDVEDTTGDITAVKNAMKNGFSTLGKLLALSKKGGVFSGKKKKRYGWR